MAHKLPTETIVFAVSFLLIGAEFVLMGDSEEDALMSRQMMVQSTAGSEPDPEPEIEPGSIGPRPDFMPDETELVEDPPIEEEEDIYEDEVEFGQPIDNTRPLVSARPEFDQPFSAEPEFGEAFDSSFGMPTEPEPMMDDFPN